MEYNTYEDLLKQESEIYKNTIEESPEIGWYILFYEALQKIITIIPNKRGEDELPKNPAIYYLNITSTLKIIYTSNSILHLISKSYYAQGMILLRTIQEEYQHMLFFNYHPPNQIKQWNEGKIKSDRIKTYMSTSKHIPKKWKGIAKDHFNLHGALSLFVHPSRIGWSGVVKVDKVTGNNILKLLPMYEKNSFNTNFVALTSFIGNTLLLLLEIYKNELKDTGIYNEIMHKIKLFESEYLMPTLHNMKLDINTRIIG